MDTKSMTDEKLKDAEEIWEMDNEGMTDETHSDKDSIFGNMDMEGMTDKTQCEEHSIFGRDIMAISMKRITERMKQSMPEEMYCPDETWMKQSMPEEMYHPDKTWNMDTQSMTDDETWYDVDSVSFVTGERKMDIHSMTDDEIWYDAYNGPVSTARRRICGRKVDIPTYEWSSDNSSWDTKRDCMYSDLVSKMEMTANKLRMWYESSYSLYPTCMGWYNSFTSAASSSALNVLKSPNRRARVRSPYSLILPTLFFSHAVLVHSGFVGLDQTSWSLTDSKILARYTLPAILANEFCVKENVLLEFRRWGKSVVVYGSLGSLSDGSSRVHRVCLDENIHGPDLRLMLAMSESKSGCSTNTEHGFQVFQLWNVMNDQLALPLLNDLRERAGLTGFRGLPTDVVLGFMGFPRDVRLEILKYLPAKYIYMMASLSEGSKYPTDVELYFMGLPTDVELDFMRLPTDVKLEILKHLPAKYIYKMACLCEDLKYLLKDKLWWRKRCERVMAKNNMDACSKQKKTD